MSIENKNEKIENKNEKIENKNEQGNLIVDKEFNKLFDEIKQISDAAILDHQPLYDKMKNIVEADDLSNLIRIYDGDKIHLLKKTGNIYILKEIDDVANKLIKEEKAETSNEIQKVFDEFKQIYHIKVEKILINIKEEIDRKQDNLPNLDAVYDKLNLEDVKKFKGKEISMTFLDPNDKNKSITLAGRVDAIGNISQDGAVVYLSDKSGPIGGSLISNIISITPLEALEKDDKTEIIDTGKTPESINKLLEIIFDKPVSYPQNAKLSNIDIKDKDGNSKNFSVIRRQGDGNETGIKDQWYGVAINADQTFFSSDNNISLSNVGIKIDDKNTIDLEQLKSRNWLTGNSGNVLDQNQKKLLFEKGSIN